MQCIHIHHHFHSVGHGTFFTGVAVIDDSNVFRWAYDCGSKRSTRISSQITNLARYEHWAPNPTIDLLVISHFDDDHINGLEQLLNQYRVKWLALPYLGLKQRLAHAASLASSDVSSLSTATFAIDPVRYLVTRGLADRVEAILLVQGGGDEESASEGNQPFPHLLEPLSNGRDDQTDGGTSDYLFGPPATQPAGPPLHLWSHQKAIAPATFPLEFVFFNAALPDGRANRSKLPLGVVGIEVDRILTRFGMLDPSKPPRPGWREELKKCYVRHFGNTAAQRNNISLCLMVRPLMPRNAEQCGIFSDDFSEKDHEIDISISSKPALLLTGDLALDPKMIDAAQLHFQGWRWRDVGVVQVPHHGSRHSWFQGNVGRFPDPDFVQCAPSSTANGHHPHAMVVQDLAASRVAAADYCRAVHHCYHFQG